MAPHPKSSRYSSRPFIVSLLLISILTAYALIARPLISNPFQAAILVRSTKEPEPDCRAVHHAVDQCAFILANCEDDEAGLLHYLKFYYCTLGNAKPMAFTILAVWMGLLFTTIGIAASDFFSINLSTIARVLGLSENLAGVTFLAFGNGSPDVFSTFAAMRSNSGSMAIGELIGAASFITAVVAGSMALVREFKVSKRTFVRDILFFIVAISFTMIFLADGELHLWECFTMIGFYLAYVGFVVGWHWYVVRKGKQRRREIESRSHLLGAPGHGSEDLEPYRDFPDDEEGPLDRRTVSAPEPADISALERGPRIEIDDGRGDEEEERREIHAAAEMTSSMRVNRPRWGRSNTTITPIRPSLVGALEFRSVLSSLQRARNMQLAPLTERMYSDHAQQLSGALERSATVYEDARVRARAHTSLDDSPTAKRDRALSHGNLPLNLGSHLPEIISEEPSPGVGRTTSSTIDGRLAPPSPAIMATEPTEHQPKGSDQSRRSDRPPQLQIPPLSRRSSIRSSPSLSPFPGFTESPGALTPLPQNENQTFAFPPLSERRLSTAHPIEDNEGQPKPIRWWPYGVLPPPHVLLSTLFPTLQGWQEKSLWDKLVGLISVPSVFVLVTTLPVAESESKHTLDDDEPGPLGAIQPGSAILPISVQEDTSAQPEAAAWQEFRRRTRSVSSRTPPAISPRIFPADGPEAGQHSYMPSISVSVPQLAEPGVAREPDHLTTTSTEEDQGWNRWLIALQLFTGPLFVVFIWWASELEGMENPARQFLKLAGFSLALSTGLLIVLLLLTSPDKKPKYHFTLCFLGFIISIAWISTIAGEVVGVLKAFGVILNISEAILGLTIFAVGNSLGDLVADVTVARLGFPVMALAACFGGPMLNILLGIGIAGAAMGVSSANKQHLKHPDRPLRYSPYRIQVGGTLIISAIGVLTTLIVLLITVPSNKWVMSRKIGFGLIGIWSVTTIVNLVVEATGMWSDVA
ncbi:Sodium/calcium exchanger protein-domain-containing protein [Cercophora newfieldiana]|uniref:Sodium/calcium exchanger protein-domain-containing protein n=1 Tax=Cercophora newfieldiana TaxID=92897 RepID=A0AA39YUE6_9PEZI|nr:Sodium/calcium exchanger protein-domain-containing protein [Cercophora newfieldiana]